MSSPAEPAPTALGPDLLLDHLRHCVPRPERYWLGFSGGVDSTVLLHLLTAIRDRLDAPLAAIHVDHRLQPQSTTWAAHCEAACRQLGVPLTVCVVDAVARRGESPEAAARTARYAAFAQHLGPRGMLLTAHHLDDQAETLLLQLLRGSGVDGLAAMPAVRAWAGGWHARPLLDIDRDTILAWAGTHRLQWIDDPSNARTTADRNYLRHAVMPQLAQRWPAATRQFARSAALCAQAAATLRTLADADLRVAASADGRRIRIAALRELPEGRSAALLRHWLRDRGLPPLPAARLHEALRQLCEAGPDTAVEIAWEGVALRRFRDEAWLVRSAAPGLPSRPIAWNGEMLALGPGLGAVRRRHGPGGIDPAVWPDGGVQIGFRQPGMRCRPAGRQGTRSFKKLLQDCAIPPWLRDRVPVVLIDGRPAAIAGCCTCAPFAATDRDGWLVDWIPDADEAPPTD